MRGFLVVILTLVAGQCFSFNNPQIRVCRNVGADFIQIKNDGDKGICLFGSSSFVGAIDLIETIHFDFQTLAIGSFLSTKSKMYKECPVESEQATFKDSDDNSYRVCLYSDGSIIGEKTLIKGFYHPANTRLVKALFKK